MKSHTDIEQSKKLAKILPIKTSDMYYWCGEDIRFGGYKAQDKDYDIPCWSLAALLEVLPEYNLQRTDWGYKTEYKIVVTINDEDNYVSKNYDNPLDACVDMILKLKEKNLL